MYYSSVGFLALILHIIINKNIITADKDQPVSRAMVRYKQFLYSVTGYYIVDILWGAVYALKIVPITYAVTVVYFLLMVTTVVLWASYVIEYLDKRGKFSFFLRQFGLAICVTVIASLIVNFFDPIFFYFTETGEYATGPWRYVALGLQFILYVLSSAYTLYMAVRTEGKEKIHNLAVGFTCLSMEILIVLQVLFPLLPFYAMGILIEICIIHSYLEMDEKVDRDNERQERDIAYKERDVYNQISLSLAGDYEAIYYIDIETGEYREFSTSKEYESMEVPAAGEDFYVETMMNCNRYVHQDDREFARSLYHRDTILKNLEGRSSYSYKYRIMVGEEARYFRFTVMLSPDGRHFILTEKDIQDEITAESILMENQKHHATFTQIAESLASNYDMIYYVDLADGNYISYRTNNIYGLLEAKQSGDDFFEDSKTDIPKIVHKKDIDRVSEFMSRDSFLSVLESRKQYDLNYRIMNNGKVQHLRMSVRKTSDMTHFIVGIENVDEEVKKEEEHLLALNAEKELARRDELTGIKNKTAYGELEESVQNNLDNGMDYLPFGIVVCDVNNLKIINDTQGHKAGDEYIKAAAKMLCDSFKHSPVFRIGGDEFVIFLRGEDYASREKLLTDFRADVMKNRAEGSGPIVAVGMAEYEQGKDKLVSDIFKRADELMYENKQKLKAGA